MIRRGYYAVVGSIALALASAPYLYGWLATPPGHVYSGLTTNIDDCLVYLSWMHQAAAGRFFQGNLFCVEPQRPVLFSVWFLLLGSLARVLPTMLVFHAARIAGGALLLLALRALLQEALSEERARRIAFALLCFSAGFGWLFGGYDPARGFTSQPIDLFQPEAITFLSLYYSPLFAPATALMVAFLAALLRAERTGRLRDVWPAAAAGALLGNFHSYDVISLFSVALAWRIVSDARARRLDRSGWLRLIVVGLAALPTTGYTAWASRIDPLFQARAFVNEGTWTPKLPFVLLGYGLVALLAASAALYPPARAKAADAPAWRLLLVWGTVGIAVAYLPFPFQRKLLMGAQIPLCLLAGSALAALSERLSGDFPRIAVGTALALSAASNGLFLLQDIGRLSVNAGSTAHRPYLTAGEAGALEWLRLHASRADAVLVAPDPTSHRRFPFTALMPHLSCYVPGWAGAPVYDGHWSETIRFAQKLAETIRFFSAETDDPARRTFLSERGIRYILYPGALAAGPPTDPGGASLGYLPVAWSAATHPEFLEPVYSSPDVIIFRFIAGGA